MSRRSFHDFALALALLAAGLLALAPSVSRLLAQPAPAGWIALCSAAGMKWLRVDAGSAATPDIIAIENEGNATGHGDDCGYCPLLATLATLFTVLALALLLHAPAPSPVARAAKRPAHRYPCGLGSRGPPCTLQMPF